MANLILFCGSPASGKTTLSKQISKEYNIKRFSFDEMHCLQHKELIFPVMQTLTNNQSVIIDSVFTYAKWRKQILDAISNICCNKICIYMDTPLDECIRRNARRSKPLPEFVVRSIYNSIEPPSINEGWDEIIYYKGE